MVGVDEAISMLKDEDVSVRKEAIKSLERVEDEAIIEPLIEATKDEKPVIRLGAAEILGNFGDVAVDKLIDEFNKETGVNKRFLAVALQKTGSKKAVDCFASVVDDEDFGVRKVAIRGLGELQAADKLDVIAKGLDDVDAGVRTATIFALGDLATPESVALIKKARRNEKDKDFKKYCNKAIKKAEKIIKAGGKLTPASKAMPMSQIKEIEKTGDLEAAIKAYEVHVKEKSEKDAPYKRLAMLYRKTNDYDNEIRILKIAIEILSKAKPGKEEWFEKRLSKMC